ncbi:MAG: transcriptional repressor [Tissierellia bacterium]|nr:transcriptional repressor [Tissierellia bacterium]
MIKNQEMITQILKNKEITPSYTRIKIYDYLAKDKIHPTVDEIYLDLVQFFPTLSKTTVYNTLKLFVEKDIIRAVNLYDNKMRYELIRSKHSHLKCDVCENIYDIPADINVYLPDELKGTIINENHLLITGTCSHCLKKQ